MDDTLLIGNINPTSRKSSLGLGIFFTMKDLGEATYILGIKIYRNGKERLLGLSQSTYFDKILKRFNMENSMKDDLTMHHTVRLRKTLCPSSDKDIDTMTEFYMLQL